MDRVGQHGHHSTGGDEQRQRNDVSGVTERKGEPRFDEQIIAKKSREHCGEQRRTEAAEKSDRDNGNVERGERHTLPDERIDGCAR
jgi:hypothetical protein